MSSQICLKWNSFLNNIATSFESLWEEEGLVDVTLASDGQCLTAHKVILSASSPFFKKVFQTNPCQHPVIILQDVHFSELEALLIFIYKGEVNIEQKNLPALLKAAETLQIRGLSGGDIVSKESFKQLAELERNVEEDSKSIHEENPKKKQKISRAHSNSILEKALTPQTSRSEGFTDLSTSDKSKDSDCTITETLPEEVYQRLEMKIEPFEMAVDDLPKPLAVSRDSSERLSADQTEGSQGSSSKSTVTVIAEARQMRSPSPCPHSLSNVSCTNKNYVSDSLHLSVESSKTLDTSIDELHHVKASDDRSDSLPSWSDNNSPTVQDKVFPLFVNPSVDCLEDSQSFKGGPSYPPFPCPFCDRAYTSWGFRRRHIKAVHTISPSLSCKWCTQVLPTHAAWRRHVVAAHNLSASDAHNGLLILEEAHMVLQIAHPTRLDTLVNIIKQSSQQNNIEESSAISKD